MRKLDFCTGKNKSKDQQLISDFVFATWYVLFLFFLNPKFQVSSHLLQLHRPVCVRPGWKLQAPFFLFRGSNLSPTLSANCCWYLCILSWFPVASHSFIRISKSPYFSPRDPAFSYCSCSTRKKKNVSCEKICLHVLWFNIKGPVVQNFVSLTSSLRPQLVK